MDNNKFELNPLLKDASLDKAASLANNLLGQIVWGDNRAGQSASQVAADLSYILEYLRLNFDLISKD